MKKKSVTVISLILMLMIMFMFEVGSAFAYHPTVEVNTVNGHTILQFMSKKGLKININVAKTGTITLRYLRILRQANKGLALAKVTVYMVPGKNKLVFAVFKKFLDVSDGAIYSHQRKKLIHLVIAKMRNNKGKYSIKSDIHFTSPEVQDLSFNFNYPQSKSGNFYSKLIKFAKVPGKNQYNIVFSTINGLEYSILTSANAKQILISIIKNKLKTNLFGISLSGSYSSIELMNPDNKKKKGEIAFVYKNSSKPSVHIIGHNNINLYHNFK